MPRLFFAIRTSDEQRSELRRIQQALSSQLSALHADHKLENLTNSHCTLKFLGDVDAGLIERLKGSARVEINAIHIAPFSISLTDCDTFSHSGKTRVIWVGLTAAPELLQLRTALDAAVTQIGTERKSAEAFHPHLTLIRFREPYKLLPTFDFPIVKAISTLVSEIELIQSKTLATGAVHEVIARFAL